MLNWRGITNCSYDFWELLMIYALFKLIRIFPFVLDCMDAGGRAMQEQLPRACRRMGGEILGQPRQTIEGSYFMLNP